ncbi:MAG: transketolase C-terminal domain-containing protein, partial [Acetanaerobacterium sp.]
IMFAAENQLDNLCVLVDKNNGQSDDTHKLFLGMEDLSERLTAFGFRVLEADGGNMASILACLQEFKRFPRSFCPTAIICNSYKGFGGYATTTGKHKASFNDEEVAAECALLAHTRKARVHNLNQFDRAVVGSFAKQLGYTVEADTKGSITGLVANEVPVKVKRAAPRDKALSYDAQKLPNLEVGKAYGATDVAIAFTRVFAASEEFYTIDADLSNVSGLYTGTGLTNRHHAINAGIAECNMMCMAEGLAACGANVWVSTFGPFFDWQAFRRIAVSYQERCEAIEAPDSWLSEGHNLDITFLSTASNLDTAVNGATHMSNDDICFFDQLAHVKIIDTCCPRQFLSVAKWIAQGNRGLVYLRVMRSPSPALYAPDYEFAYGKGNFLRRADNAKAVVISSGHGVLEALSAAELLDNEGVAVSIVDMPSYDGQLLRELAASGAVLLFAEQNNGALLDRFSRDLLTDRFPCDLKKVLHLNTRDREERLQFIQSGTY